MTQNERKMRIGILGAGGVAKDLHLPVLINMPEVSVTWLCDKDKKRAQQLAKLFRIPAVFADIEQCRDVDIVLVAIPVGYRGPVMQSIFRRGWHAFCEKPFAISLKEHDQYLEEAQKHNLQIGIGLVRRFCPATIMAKKIVSQGFFGPITRVWASEGFRTKRTGQDASWYMGDPKIAGGGVLMEIGSHLVDQLCTIFDVTRFKVGKCIQRTFNKLEFETRFVGSISNKHQQEIPCTFEVSRIEDLCNGIFIQYSDFILKCGLFFEDSLELLTLKGDHVVRFEINDGAKTIGQAFFLEWQDFIDQCISGSPSYVGADTARHSTAIIEQCYSSAELIDIDNNNIKVFKNG
ncbi:MAG: Gfo/Idh/MocA family protein [Candidatus Hodarchaeota archaeon]